MKYWRLVLALWLVLMGLVQALDMSFRWIGVVLGVIACISAALLVMDR